MGFIGLRLPYTVCTLYFVEGAHRVTYKNLTTAPYGELRAQYRTGRSSVKAKFTFELI